MTFKWKEDAKAAWAVIRRGFYGLERFKRYDLYCRARRLRLGHGLGLWIAQCWPKWLLR